MSKPSTTTETLILSTIRLTRSKSPAVPLSTSYPTSVSSRQCYYLRLRSSYTYVTIVIYVENFRISEASNTLLTTDNSSRRWIKLHSTAWMVTDRRSSKFIYGLLFLRDLPYGCFGMLDCIGLMSLDKYVLHHPFHNAKFFSSLVDVIAR